VKSWLQLNEGRHSGISRELASRLLWLISLTQWSFGHDPYGRFRYRCNETRAFLGGNLLDLPEGIYENCRHLVAGEVSIREHEGAHSSIEECLTFMLTVADPIVLRQNNPASLPHDREPVRVLCVSRKVIVVNFDTDTRLTKGRCDLVFAERAV
jgi:hypothetical protein